MSVVGTVPALFLIETWGRRKVIGHLALNLLAHITAHIVASNGRSIGSRMCTHCENC